MADDANKEERDEQGGLATARIGVKPYETVISVPGPPEMVGPPEGDGRREVPGNFKGYSGGHEIQADEPVYAGGGGKGPAPIDLMTGALAACKALTLRMQADRHGWPMTGAVVKATHRRVNARELGEGAKGSVDLIECEITLEGDELTAKQRQKLLALADSCWVQHALRTPTRITSRLAE